MPAIEFSRYYGYDELTALLRAFESEYPDLVQIESIGKSHEGRDIWLATVTDRSTGPASEKPAFWCDGNIHASELSASTAVLKILTLLATDPKHRPLLRERAVYLVPRLNPDGAEWSLESPPRVVRSSTRPYPYDEDDLYGLERKDLDGDGRILSMRIPDSNGPWVVSDLDPRLLKRIGPGETSERRFRLMPEGILHNWDGMTLRGRRIKEGLDLNRNYPQGWRPESEQHGAGPFPTSEPEIRAAVAAIVARPNICGAIAFHTYSGVHLRPPSTKADDELPPEDVWTYKSLGAKGTEMTGYPAIAIFHEFRYHPKETITGVFDDWMYEQRGVFAWTTEIWSPQRQAGITDYKYIDWFRDHPHEDDLKMLRWSDEQLDGQGHIDWKPFDHPQLGPVEIGGWDAHFAFRNPPPKFLEAEVTPLAEWAIWHSGCGPRLVEREVRVEPSGAGWRIRAAVQNAGWLPTHVTENAKAKSLLRGVVAEIAPPSGAPEHWLVSGLLRQEAGQLSGLNLVSAGGFGWHADPTTDVAVFEWVVAAPGDYEIVVKHDRAGTLRLRASAT